MVILVIFILSLFFGLAIHLFYPVVLELLVRRSRFFPLHRNNEDSQTEKSLHELPLVSVIIPVFNEESVIERRINNIFESSFPQDKLEVIVVESGSTDRTRSILEEKFQSRVILLKEETRNGKAHAINLALEICKGEVIVITDGPTLYQTDTIPQLVSSFEDPSVGGASGLYRISNASENLITSSEHAFWLHKDNLRIFESNVYSTSWLSGEACAFKKSIIGKVNENTLADDSNIAFQILSKGYKVKINSKSLFTEKSPSVYDEYFKIKTRRALGGLIETLRFRSFLFKPRYGYFGLIIFPYRFFAQLISPIISFFALILLVPAVFELALYIGHYLTLFIGIIAVYAVFRFRIKLFAYISLQIISIMALLQFTIKKNNVLWKQSTTTRS